MFSWIAESMWNSTTESVKTNVESVKNETRILSEHLYDAVKESGVEKQQRTLEEYKKTKEELKARHEERRAAFNARHAREGRAEEYELSKWKEEIQGVLTAVNNEITALSSSYTSHLWHFKIKAKMVEKEALANLYNAHTLAELRVRAAQQIKNPEIGHNPTTDIGRLRESIVNAGKIAEENKEPETKKKQWSIW